MDADGTRSKGIARSLRKLGVMVSVTRTLQCFFAILDYEIKMESKLEEENIYI